MSNPLDTYLNHDGSQITIATDYPLIGLSLITGIVDNISGGTGATIIKKFAYSFDNIIWSPFEDLSLTNLQQVPSRLTKPLYFQFQYSLQGEPSIPAQWNYTEIQGSFQALVEDQIFSNSTFAEFLNQYDIDILKWCFNVVEKIYIKGGIGNWIERGGENAFENDRDFVDFWTAISRFFSYYVIFTRHIANIDYDHRLLRDFILEKGLHLGNNESLTQLRLLSSNFFRELAKRGSYSVFEQDRYSFNGEFLRLINYYLHNEFLVNIHTSSNYGWILNRTSPQCSGVLLNDYGFLKKWEKEFVITDPTKYPVYDKTQPVTVVVDSDGDKALQFTISGNNRNGIRDLLADRLFKINPYLTYRCTFDIQMNDFSLCKVRMGFDGYSLQQGSPNILLFENALGAPNQTYSFQDYVFRNNPSISNQLYYTVDCIIYGVDDTSIVTNNIYGINFVFNANHRYVCPILMFINSSINNAIVRIKNVKFTPLKINDGRAVLNSQPPVRCIYQNNSQYTELGINNIAEDQLLPYSRRLLQQELVSIDVATGIGGMDIGGNFIVS